MLAAVTLLSAGTVCAQWKPQNPVEIVVASGPGGGMDKTARTIQVILRDKKIVDIPLNVVNKAGGGGSIGWAYLSQHPHDAHYLAIGSPALLTNHITGKAAVSYADFTPLALLVSEYTAFAVSSESTIKTGQDLLDRLRKDPRSVSVAISTGLGAGNHVAVGKMGKAAGVDIAKLRLIVYSATGEAITAVLGGHVDLIPVTVSSVLPYVQPSAKQGLRILAIASPRRLGGVLAGVPTWREQGLNVEQDSFRAVMGSKDMTPAQIAYWDAVFRALADSTPWQADLENNLWVNNYRDSAGARKYLAAEYNDYKIQLKELGVIR
jgi:putative tricarboxylic transport membrane protein